MTVDEPWRTAATRLPALAGAWPLPALLTWLAAWALALALRALATTAGSGAAPAAWLGAAAGCALGAGLALAARRLARGRRLWLAAGFPLSALAAGWGAGLPAWAWLLPALALLLAYPVRAWRDAPLFPTPPQALAGAAARLALPAAARVLDAGCGLGHGLAALRAEWPSAQLHGIEWSRPLAWLAARRCRWAQVRRGDMWAASWAGYQLVYLFQRPESMGRAWAKACAEMAPGHWLASLEFPVPGVPADALLHPPGGRPLWLYRLPPPGLTRGARGR